MFRFTRRLPGECSADELQSFEELIIAGGEVSPRGLRQLMESAARLVFLQQGMLLVGTAAVKSPRESYRRRVSEAAGVNLNENKFPHELGWVYLSNAVRGQGLSAELISVALSGFDGGVFATSSADNVRMHATLRRARFGADGVRYGGKNGALLQVFCRHGK